MKILAVALTILASTSAFAEEPIQNHTKIVRTYVQGCDLSTGGVKLGCQSAGWVMGVTRGSSAVTFLSKPYPSLQDCKDAVKTAWQSPEGNLFICIQEGLTN